MSIISINLLRLESLSLLIFSYVHILIFGKMILRVVYIEHLSFGIWLLCSRAVGVLWSVLRPQSKSKALIWGR